ncbi:MAG: hypothetical protein AAF563_19075 [Pseudomonadota bacterium]
MTATVTDIAFSPLLPLWLLIPFAAVVVLLLVYGVVRGAPGMAWRTLVLAALALAMANPSLIEERREALPDIALIVVDESASQTIGERDEQTQTALDAMLERFERLDNLETRVVTVDALSALDDDGLPASGTALFAPIRQALADVPREAVSGAVLITDGEVHDAPQTLEAFGVDAPVHVLLTGERQEVDRRLVLLEAPRYGIVDQPTKLAFRVEDSNDPTGTAEVTLTAPGVSPVTHTVPIGERYEIFFSLDRAGMSMVELDLADRPNELTDINNRVVLAVNGVREDLKVLLISGEVHTGERVWRNTLKADPAVELVHFTILRPPEKQDGTPIRELSLISFPVRELFEMKLLDFDLIIFDRYRKRGVIPEQYLENIAEYVLEGGAMLVAAGPDFGTQLGLHTTVLGELMPAIPTGDVVEYGFNILPTDTGRRHPVTADLPGAQDELPDWGRWFRQVNATAPTGEVLLDGYEGQPLLILQRVGEGRVAQLLSDHAWLWARGYEGGGPQQELLRRLAHWLMKEPELEENAIRVSAIGNRLSIIRQSLEDEAGEVTVIAPSGTETTATLTNEAPGRSSAEIRVSEAGLYRVTDGELETIVTVGELNPREWRDPRAKTDMLQPIVDATGGGITWIADERLPTVRQVAAERDRSGQGWIGVLDHGRFIVRGIDNTPLLPAWLALLLIVGGLAMAWRAEGR